MDKNKDNTFDKPTPDIQEQISRLMGPTFDEAPAQLDSKQKEPAQTLHQNENIEPKDNTALATEPMITSVDQPDIESSDVTQSSQALDSHGTHDEIDDAVEDIIKKESDIALAQQDADVRKYIIEPKKKHNKLVRTVVSFWHHKFIRNALLAIIILGLIGVLAFPSSRYSILNAVGVQAEMSLKVADAVSGRPIKNVTVNVQGKSETSNENGEVSFTNLQLGESTVTFSKRSFADQSVPIIIGWGSNPIESPYEMVPTGTTFPFTVTDWLSGLPLENAEVSDGESTAVTDSEGKTELTIEPTDSDIDITVEKEGYKEELVTIPASSTEPVAVSMVIAPKDVFISKRDGRFDVYSRYIDGSDEILLLPGTGTEQNDTHVVPNASGTLAAVVSSREGTRNDDGFILSNLYSIDVTTKEVLKINGTESERIRIVGWSGDSVIFVKTVAGPSGAVGDRQRVIAYDTKSAKSTELAKANYFSDVRFIDDSVYYSVNDANRGSESDGLTVVKVNGTERRTILAKDIWTVYRSAPSELTLFTNENEWYSVTLPKGEIALLEGAPALQQNNTYAQSPSGGQFARLEERDGKMVILLSKKSEQAPIETEILRQSGIGYSMRWLSESVILYTVQSTQETAHYVIDTIARKPVKVGDITWSTNVDSPYY